MTEVACPVCTGDLAGGIVCQFCGHDTRDQAPTTEIPCTCDGGDVFGHAPNCWEGVRRFNAARGLPRVLDPRDAERLRGIERAARLAVDLYFANGNRQPSNETIAMRELRAWFEAK